MDSQLEFKFFFFWKINYFNGTNNIKYLTETSHKLCFIALYFILFTNLMDFSYHFTMKTEVSLKIFPEVKR